MQEDGSQFPEQNERPRSIANISEWPDLFRRAFEQSAPSDQPLPHADSIARPPASTARLLSNPLFGNAPSQACPNRYQDLKPPADPRLKGVRDRHCEDWR